MVGVVGACVSRRVPAPGWLNRFRILPVRSGPKRCSQAIGWLCGTGLLVSSKRDATRSQIATSREPKTISHELFTLTKPRHAACAFDALRDTLHPEVVLDNPPSPPLCRASPPRSAPRMAGTKPVRQVLGKSTIITRGADESRNRNLPNGVEPIVRCGTASPDSLVRQIVAGGTARHDGVSGQVNPDLRFVNTRGWRAIRRSRQPDLFRRGAERWVPRPTGHALLSQPKTSLFAHKDDEAL